MRMSELAEQVAIADQLREERPMSKEGLFLNLGFMVSELERVVRAHPGCLNNDQEYQVMRMRMQLETVARVGGTIEAFIDGTAASPMPRLQAAE